MASSLLASSRNMSRYIGRFTYKNLAAGRESTKGLVIQTRTLSCLTQQPGRKSNSNITAEINGSFVRNFRVTPSFCDEVRVVQTPSFADSISEGDLRWIKAVGDAVGEDEVVGEIETDKTALEVKAPVAGVIQEFLVEDGSTVTAHMDLFKMVVGGEGAAPAAKEVAPPPPAAGAAASPAAAQPAAPAPTAASGAIPTSPPPVPAKPTAPMQTKPVAAVKPVQASPAPLSAPGARVETRVKMNRMRLRIAQRLKEAQNSCAMLTTFNEIDMSNVIDMRATYKDAFLKKHGLKLGFMSAFIKASANALTAMPEVNAYIDEKEILYREYVDISVAVATPKGLVVPVLRNVENMNYVDIEVGLSELAEKARDMTLAIEDMDGGTFTISNGGVYGSMFGTPIINPPQSAILGMHGIFQRPVAIAGKVEIRPMMYVALTYDHRLIDGREGVLFLKKIKSAVEDPRVLLMDL